ncbi:MAG: integrase arm-type DNA-binding domain-containing protein, partial [Gemmatimonadaceae bacterium]
MSGGMERRAQSTDRLSDRAIKSWLTKRRAGTATTTKLSDGGGLYLTLTPSDSAMWRIKYRYGGAERLYAVGAYPTIALAEARVERDRVKAHLRDGRDPVQMRQLSRVSAVTAADTTLAGVTTAWLAKRKADWSGIHFTKSSQALERDVLPLLGKLPVAEITPAMVAKSIEGISKRGAHDTASKVLWHLVGIFKLAQARGWTSTNPAVPVREELPKKRQHEKRPALLTFAALGEVLRKADVAPISPAVRMAHRLVAFTGARIGNVVNAPWSEFDLENDVPMWRIPRKRMKVADREHDHDMPLGPTIAAELRTWKRATGGGAFVFPSPMGNAHITRESLEKAYRVTLGLAGTHSVHGWRSSLSTLAR